MGQHNITEISEEKFQFSGRTRMMSIILIIAGLVLAGIGAMQLKNQEGSHTAATETEQVVVAGQDADHGPVEATHEAETVDADHGHNVKSWTSRVWANLLLNSYYFLLFGVGALFFLAVNYVANAGWATLLKRIAESMSAYIFVGLLVLMVIIFLAKDHFYHWVAYFEQGFSPTDAGYDRILESKSWLLSKQTLYGVVPAIIVIWALIRWKLRSNSIKEDKEGGLAYFRNSTRWSAGFVFFFAFSFSALSWIIIMSIDAHWYSTMFSVYNFAVAFVTSLTVMMMFLLFLKSKGYMEIVSDEVVHDLGKFMFAFCIFWGYIFLSQWLLIWYANIPEETVYFAARFVGIYEPMFYVNIIMCFVLPFLILMMRNVKRNPVVLVIAGIVILVGHWVDIYLMVMPGVIGQDAGIGLLEVGTTLAFTGLFITTVLYSLSKANLYPKNHPYVLESVNHDVGP